MPMHRPIPVDAHAYGLDSSRKRPTLNASPEPKLNQVERKRKNHGLVTDDRTDMKTRLELDEMVKVEKEEPVKSKYRAIRTTRKVERP